MNRHNYQLGQKGIRNGRLEFELDNRAFHDGILEQLHPGDTLEHAVIVIHYFLEPDVASSSGETLEIHVRSGDAPALLARLTFAQLSELPPNQWHVLGPAGQSTCSEPVPLA
jgi:hypothetical protein